MEHYLADKPLKEILLALEVIEIVRKRQRNVPDGRGVLPKNVQGFLDSYRNESTLRRDMSKLWRAGLLERCGGTSSSRQGYRVTRGFAA